MSTKRENSAVKKVYKIRLKKGDNVIVTAGKFKGQTGVIATTHPTTNRVSIEGVNVVKRNLKRDMRNPQGGVKEFTRPLPVSNVAVVDPTSKKPSKIGYSFDKAGNKVRVYKRSGKEIK